MKTIETMIRERGGLDALRDRYIRIENPGYMRLVVEHIGTGPRGLPLLSVCHYGEQNGDAMRDPDMTFEIVVFPAPDERLPWRWLPVSFRNDYAGVDNEAVFPREGDGVILYRPAMVKDLAAFSQTWDRNIKEQGFVEAERAARAAEPAPVAHQLGGGEGE